MKKLIIIVFLVSLTITSCRKEEIIRKDKQEQQDSFNNEEEIIIDSKSLGSKNDESDPDPNNGKSPFNPITDPNNDEDEDERTRK